MAKRSPYSALTKAIYTAPSRSYVAVRPFEVRSQGPWGEAIEGRYTTVSAAMSAADRIAGRSAPAAIVMKGRDVLYKAGR